MLQENASTTKVSRSPDANLLIVTMSAVVQTPQALRARKALSAGSIWSVSKSQEHSIAERAALGVISHSFSKAPAHSLDRAQTNFTAINVSLRTLLGE
jgi:hypothetical protein